MKFHTLQIYQNLDKFSLKDSRNFLDLLAIQKLMGLIAAKNILEIGYFEGLLFGLLYETSSPNTVLTSCDITYERDIFRKLGTIKKQCNFYNCSSIDLKLDNQYDFIVVDGDHSYDTVIKELNLLDSWATDDCIILVDDYNLPGVEKALAEWMPNNSNFVPALLGAQQLFLVRKNNQSFDHVVEQLKQTILCVSSWSTVEYFNWHIDQYQYKHKIYINTLKEIITKLDL